MGQEPSVWSTRRGIWLLVPDPFFEPCTPTKNGNRISQSELTGCCVSAAGVSGSFFSGEELDAAFGQSDRPVSL
jgi:hypothetical protein